MPSETFERLAENKKKAIFDAAVEEFSNHSFSQASINQVVQSAGISRGSFYQYFRDKEDLYMYVLGEIAREKMTVAAATRDINPHADFFETYRQMFMSILDWAESQPRYYRISMLMDYDDSAFIAKLRDQFGGNWDFFRQLIEKEKQRGRIEPHVDADIVVEMLFALNKSFFQDYWQTGSRDQLVDRMESSLNIIKGGIARV